MQKINIFNNSFGISFVCYFVFLLMGLFLRFTFGLYLYDVIILVFFVSFLIRYGKINKGVSQYLLMLGLLMLTPALISFGYQSLIGVQVSSMSFYIIYNVILLSCYIIFIWYTFKYINLNFNIVIFLLSIPIFLSIAMYFFSDISLFLQEVYSVDLYPIRFGGIFGRNVNQLGYYSTLLIILSCFLKARKKIGVVFYPVVLGALFMVVVSGMRSGILLTIGLFIFFKIISKFNMIRIRDIVGVGIIISLCLILFSNFFSAEISYFKGRFSLELLYNQMLGRHDSVHLGNMYAKWFSRMAENNHILAILFSFIPSWKFPDSFIIFLLANGGLLGLFGYIMFILFNISLITINKIKDKDILLFVLFFNVLIGIKGNFMFNNIGMFLFVFIVMVVLFDSGKFFKSESGVKYNSVR